MRWSKGAQAEGPRSRPHGVLRAREARRPASSRAAVAPSLHRATMLRDLDPQHRTLDRALAGRYVLERRLGRGGMGVVFLARELLLERRVAIKLLPPLKAADPRARQRFLDEARTVAQLSHPNIVPVFAVDESPDAVFFVMAYVEGQTLGQRIRDQGVLTPEEGARLLREVARALAHAHERGVVHRDVTPDNILLDAASGRALVFDFGIARVGGGSGSTGPQGVVGTAEYMSPEQASGLGVDARSDLYSLGVVGYHALSGRLPFDAPDGYAMLARHIAAPPPPLASIAPHVPRRLAQVVDRCLNKEPSARFPSGVHLAEAVGFALAPSPGLPIAPRAFLVESRDLSPVALAYGAIVGLAVPLLVQQVFTAADLGPRIAAAGRPACSPPSPLGRAPGSARTRRARAAWGSGAGLSGGGCFGSGRVARLHRPLPRATVRSRSPASRSCSSVLQNANRTSVRPSSGRLKKLEPGTGATPASHVSQRANSSSGRSESAAKSARM